ncbi:hypothetical protein V5E97_02790 [Singulisphaera sp. Ch08]|uniref:Tetratricopeptide repeat protein n=1 Tax=Singulisphaera sp. Ch08 TaxID=3120278 RepID=A0AAU7CI62_9BACT
MADEIPDSLKAARESLLLGVRLSKQGSYARRAPNPDSLPYFAQAHDLLAELLNEQPDHREALVMMSQISECLMDFSAALSFLARAFDAGEPKSKKLLKRLALLRENATAWRDLGLTPEMLGMLGNHLEAEGVGPAHETLQLTRDWLTANHIGDPEIVVAALERRGAFSDFQVLANVVYG